MSDSPRRRDSQVERTPRQELQQAMWSVYVHAFHLTFLRQSVLNKMQTVGPIALDVAIARIVDATDSLAASRRQRALRKLAGIGLANSSRWKKLFDTAALFPDASWTNRLKSVQAQMWRLVAASSISVDQIAVVPVQRVRLFLEQQFMLSMPGCQTLSPGIEACQVPDTTGMDHPLTTVTASADLTRTPEELARVFDPRSWGDCFTHFVTERVDAVIGGYAPHTPKPDPDPIGQPWDPSTTPHLFRERVSVFDENGENVFKNVLEMTDFQVSSTQMYLSFRLRESTAMVIPSLGVDMNQCVSLDEGYIKATLVPSSTGDPLSHVEMVKRVKFVEIEPGASTPGGMDPGEVLNYLAPAMLCMWLEDLSQGAVCCGVSPS
jgi:hypothetical protein